MALLPASSSRSREPRATVLLIEDDRDLSGLMARYLGKHDYRVETATDGRTGLDRAFSAEHDLVILDLMLPLLPGMEVLRQLRRRSTIPVIVLTAKSMPEERVAGLQAGADDYLCKPFAPDELIARMDAVLRRLDRPSLVRAAPIELHGIRLDLAASEVLRDGIRVELTSIEFAILDLLMHSAGRVLARSEISSALFQRDTSPFERSLDVHISHLRKKLERSGEPLIRSVRGIGYVFKAETRG
jgi:two-component system response regulator CpxR